MTVGETRYISLRDKLVSHSTRLLLVTAGLLTLIAVTLNINTMRLRFDAIRNNVKSELTRKGQILSFNSGQALRGLAEENAFSAVQGLVSATVQQDRDIMYGIYMDKERQPWTIVNTKNPGGSVNSAMVLNDTLSLWANALPGPGYREMKTDSFPFIEFAAPVLSRGEKLGTVRYGITTRAMNKMLAETRSSFYTDLFIMLFIVIATSTIIFFVGAKITGRQANTITEPINELTQAANIIAGGNYSKPVTVQSTDEVGLLAHSFELMRVTIKDYTDNLEKMVRERTAQLEAAQKELVEKAHQAGMAAIATDVLHNVGNLLNSVMTSGYLIREQVMNSKIQEFYKANALLTAHLDDLENFVLENPKGKTLLKYYPALETALRGEQKVLLDQANRLSEKIETIRDVIVAQQSYASGATFHERMNITEVIEFSLKIASESIERHGIRIERQYAVSPVINIQKAKLMQVVTNIIKNAKDAMETIPRENRVLTIATWAHDDYAFMSFKDAGCGITNENLEKVFLYGYTTKVTGHGFGLHSCANYMMEMHGSIRAESPGEGKGATFFLKLPIGEHTVAG
jgi:signal transduction histidine kinase